MGHDGRPSLPIPVLFDYGQELERILHLILIHRVEVCFQVFAPSVEENAMTRKQPDLLGSSLKTDIGLDRVTRTNPGQLGTTLATAGCL